MFDTDYAASTDSAYAEWDPAAIAEAEAFDAWADTLGDDEDAAS